MALFGGFAVVGYRVGFGVGGRFRRGFRRDFRRDFGIKSFWFFAHRLYSWVASGDR